MNNPPNKTTQRQPKPGKASSTKEETNGAFLPVTSPLDLWYLCQKSGYAEKSPLLNKNGHPMYQRTVTQWVRKDGENFKWHFPYYGEVGFDMTVMPPRAIMSRTEENRPSRMPLSSYELIRQNYISAMMMAEIGVFDPLLSKQFLEENLSLANFNKPNGMAPVGSDDLFEEILNKRDHLQKQKGLIRIPDVIRVKDFQIYGHARYAPENIKFLIEMKFGNDKLTEDQIKSYSKIVNNKWRKFRLLETKVCKVERGKRRQWLEEVRKTEPVFRDVRVTPPLLSSARAQALRESAGEISLLIGDIEQEQQRVRRLIQPQAIPSDVVQMRALDPAHEKQQAEQQARARASLELVLAAPFAAAGAGVLLGGGSFLGEGATVLATATGKLLQFPVKRIAVSAAANAAIFEAAAQSLHSQTAAAGTETSAFFVYIEG